MDERSQSDITTLREAAETLTKERRQNMRLFNMSDTIPFLANGDILRCQVFMRSCCPEAWKAFKRLIACAALFSASYSHAATNYTVNVSLPTAALQADFIANATNYFQGSVVKGIFANTYSLAVTGKNVAPPCGGVAPCELDKQVALMVSNSTKTYDYGFASGMDTERYQDIQVLYGMQGQDFFNATCGGRPVSSSTSTVSVSTTSCSNSCLQAYSVIVSTISQRWGYIFTSTGGIVSK